MADATETVTQPVVTQPTVTQPTVTQPTAVPAAPESPANYQMISWGLVEGQIRVVMKAPSGNVFVGTVGGWVQLPQGAPK